MYGLEEEADKYLKESIATEKFERSFQYSIAISLKRIADVLESVLDHRYDSTAIRTREER